MPLLFFRSCLRWKNSPNYFRWRPTPSRVVEYSTPTVPGDGDLDTSPALDLSPDPSELARLVSSRQWPGAHRLWIHLTHLHIPIPPDVVYADAALHYLKNTRKIGAFFNWLDLVPPKHLAPHWANPFHDIVTHFTRDANPKKNLWLLRNFMLTTTSKGYFHNLYPVFRGLFYKHNSPEDGQKYLMRLERGAVAYEMALPDSHHPGARFRALIIRDCCHAGWLQQALNIFYRSAKIPLPVEVGELLLEKIGDLKDDEGREIAQRLIDARPGQFAKRHLRFPPTELGYIPDAIPSPFDVEDDQVVPTIHYR